jgi:hypothetical protein
MFETQKLVGAWVGLWNSYDLSRVDQLFLPDPNLTYFSSEKQGVIQGLEAVREHHRGFGFVEGGQDRGSTLWLEDLHTADFGAAAVVTGIWFFRRSTGSVQRGPVTFVYVEREGEYRLAHLHFANYPGSDPT